MLKVEIKKKKTKFIRPIKLNKKKLKKLQSPIPKQPNIDG
jgi:hypothetical protein